MTPVDGDGVGTILDPLRHLGTISTQFRYQFRSIVRQCCCPFLWTPLGKGTLGLMPGMGGGANGTSQLRSPTTR